MIEDTLANQKYIEAMRAIQKAGKEPEHSKVAETALERDFMRNANNAINGKSVSMPYKQGQYESIFYRGHRVYVR
jgi:hypothetical protein